MAGISIPDRFYARQVLMVALGHLAYAAPIFGLPAPGHPAGRFGYPVTRYGSNPRPPSDIHYIFNPAARSSSDDDSFEQRDVCTCLRPGTRLNWPGRATPISPSRWSSFLYTRSWIASRRIAVARRCWRGTLVCLILKWRWDGCFSPHGCRFMWLMIPRWHGLTSHIRLPV